MVRRQRLDTELVRRGLARSRVQAGDLISAGRVKVSGLVAHKAATQVDHAAPVVVTDPVGEPDYVSRGAHKLIGALDAVGLDPAGRRCLDAGASTGGFTDVLLRRGAASVLAVDVGYGQLAWSLRSDPRVRVLDRQNVRTLEPEQVDPATDFVVCDLSFISLALVLPALRRCVAPGADLLVMVKPQFEVGRERLGSGGVVRHAAHRVDAVVAVAEAALAEGLTVHAVAPSPLPGPSGNVEYFLWLRTAQPSAADGHADDQAYPAALDAEAIRAAAEVAVATGPAGPR